MALEQEKKYQRLLFIWPYYIHGGMGTAFTSLLEHFSKKNVFIDVYVVDTSKGPFFDLAHFRKNTKFVTEEEVLVTFYDSVISYAPWIDPTSWIEICHGKRAIQWIHCDPAQHISSFVEVWEIWLNILAARNAEIDAFICVSETAKEHFSTYFPEYASKVHAVYNIVDNDKIISLANEHQIEIREEADVLNVVTVARVCKEKGLDMAIQVHALLEKEGVHVRWYVVGDGPFRPELEELIQTYGVQGKFIVLGDKQNPYPYIKKADVFALFSRTEGFGLAVTEAKILTRPSIITNFATAHEHIESGINGLIVSYELEEICQEMKQLVQNKSLRDRFSKVLQGYRFDNEETYRQLDALLLT